MPVPEQERGSAQAADAAPATLRAEALNAAGVLATASSLCGACGEVCPVRIPIPDLIRRLRNESYDQDGRAVVAGGGYKKNLAETLVWKGWSLANRSPLLNGIGTGGDHILLVRSGFSG